MEYKIHQYRFDNFNKFEDIIRKSLNVLGYAESNPSADLNGDDVSSKLRILLCTLTIQ